MAEKNLIKKNLSWNLIAGIEMIYSIDNHPQNLNSLLEKHAPLRQLNKKERKFQENLRSEKDCMSIFIKYIKWENRILKKGLHLKYKNYGNLLLILLMDTKKTYFSSYKILRKPGKTLNLLYL